MIGIYKITNPKGKIYIGQAVEIVRRRGEYGRLACKKQPRLYYSLLKYGFSEHIFEVIEECSVEELNERERHWQDFYDVLGGKGLNCRLTKAGDKSGQLSQEVKDKISAGNRGQQKSDSHKQNLSKAAKERERTPLRETTKQRIGQTVSEKLIGRKLSEQHKQSMSEERRVRCFEKRGHLLAINSETGQIAFTFTNISDAKSAGFDMGSIGSSIKKGHKHKGYSWKYEKK
jgi:group I intron endonuclease